MVCTPSRLLFVRKAFQKPPASLYQQQIDAEEEYYIRPQVPNASTAAATLISSTKCVQLVLRRMNSSDIIEQS